MRIPLSYNDIDLKALSKILNEFAGRDHQELVAEFEKRFCLATGAMKAVAVQSGTSALHLALLLAGVKSGDIVVAPTFCYVAAVSPIRYVQAIPLLVDVEPGSWNLDPDLVEEAVEEQVARGKRVGAIIVVHNYGVAAKMKRLLDVANRRSIPVIEDSAESFMSKVEGKCVGTLGDFGAFSFNNNKAVTTFGGGMLVSNDPAVAHRALKLATHSLEKAPYYLHNEPGFNYRMNPLAAAYGLGQLEELMHLLEHRRKIDRQYRSILEPGGIVFQSDLAGAQNQPWLTACLLPEGANPEELRAQLAKNGIETRRLWFPMHCQPLYDKEMSKLSGVSERLFRTGLCLPMGNGRSPIELVREAAEYVKDWVSKR